MLKPCVYPSWPRGLRVPQAACRDSTKSVRVQMGSFTCLWPAWVPRATRTVTSASEPGPSSTELPASFRWALECRPQAFTPGATRQSKAELARGKEVGPAFERSSEREMYRCKCSRETPWSQSGGWTLDTKVKDYQENVLIPLDWFTSISTIVTFPFLFASIYGEILNCCVDISCGSLTPHDSSRGPAEVPREFHEVFLCKTCKCSLHFNATCVRFHRKIFKFWRDVKADLIFNM